MTTASSPVDVYWRRGCGACASLRVALAEAGVPVVWHDIWAEADAAAYVRSVAGGNETVPTVRVGERVLVAPSPRRVLDELQEIDPALVASTRRWSPLRVLQWVSVIGLVVAGLALSAAGHTGWSWAADAGAVAAYLGLRRLRARPRRLPPPAR